MGENGLVNKIKDSIKNKTAQLLVPTTILTTALTGCTVHNTIYTDNLETRTVVRYVNTPNRFFINNSYWNFYNFDPRMNRVHFRRFHRGNYINFYLGVNDLKGYGIYFNYQNNTPYTINQQPFYQKDTIKPYKQNNNYRPNTRIPNNRRNTGNNNRIKR